MSPAVIAWSAFVAMFVVVGALYVVWVAIDRPEPARDDDTTEWMHSLVGPARVMADPALTRLAVLGRAVADAARGRDTMACGCAPGGPSCEWWAGQLHPLNVSGPATAPPTPALPSPNGGAAGPETPDDGGTGPGDPEWDRRFWGVHYGSPGEPGELPPVDQAAHLQPIEWADAAGSFRAICAGDYR